MSASAGAVSRMRARLREAYSKLDVIVDLPGFARGRPCQFRIPGVCDGGTETTVWAHVRRGHVGGVGLKPPDICGGIACRACHDVIDGRARWVGMEGDELISLDTLILEGVLRSQALVWREAGL